MSKYLFLFTIGPVQSFISTARKTKDLYAGSKILSELIDIAIKKFNNNSNIIFPYHGLESKPNRFLAIVENQSPEELGRILEKEVLDYFKKLSNNIPKINNTSEYFKTIFDNQIKDFLNIYWAAIPYNENDYFKSYEELEKYLASIKNIKNFSQINIDEKHRKCSLAGDRDALIFYEQEKLPAYSFEQALKIDSNDISIGEGLSAISALKRFYKFNKSFPSTSEICLMEAFEKLQDKVLKEFYNRFDYQLCYEENLTSQYLRKNNISLEIDEIIANQRKLISSSKYTNSKLTKYYAILVFDGDSMGDWLSGRNLKDKSKLKEFHKMMSKQLGEFAQLSKDYLNEPRGKAVYAGGDDFLGFININYIFDVLRHLREKFSETMKPLREYTDNKEFTFSAGVSIAHYKTPLGEVLNWSRKMEKEAKELSEYKDAFAIAVLKHSGEIHKTVYRFKDSETNLPEVFDYINKSLANDYFSDTFVKSLGLELNSLLDVKSSRSKDEVKKKIIETEIKRLINRSYISENMKSSNKQIEDFITQVNNLFNQSHSIKNFISALNILTFLKREINQEENK